MFSFATSLCLHGTLLAWMVLGPPLPGPEPRKSIYEQEIKPSEKKIVWYSLREKLPDISPSDAPLDPRPPRASVKAKQTIVSGAKDDPGATQRIWMPAPEVAMPKPLPLPNVIAVTPPPKIVKAFVAPPDVVQPPKAAPALPEAPKVAAVVAAKPLALDAAAVKPKPLAFTPPPDERMQRQAKLQLPEAPVISTVVEPNALPFEAAGARPQRKAYTPPAGARPRNDAPVALPNAPELAAVTANAVPGVKGIPRTFVAPPSRPAATGGAPTVSTDAPAIGSAPTGQAEAALAIVGLNPASMTEVPAPPGSRSAGFSAGPELRSAGGMGSAGGAALLGVPGLMVRGGANDAQSTMVGLAPLAPTSRENLTAAARTLPKAPAPPVAPPSAGATRVTEAPDPRLSGRVVYTVAIQMPNVTSFSGSWLVWFAEHEPVPGAPQLEIKAPVPLHKVDPKYVAAAAAERIEGKVRLYGVIRKDGHVDGIALIQHVDVRLDRTAAEALGQWVFEPAQRNGRPVDVDAVFEIPFHLAPRVTK